jgi:hypothetical protein
MNVQPMHIQGGAKPGGIPIYCGSKIKPPRGKIRGRPVQCFKAGRRAGFYAGINKAQAAQSIDIEDASNDLLKGLLMRQPGFRVGQVRAMTRQQLFDVFRNQLNITRIPVPNL